ncbi:MAG: cytochrome c oxidase subunit II [Acidimicrobiia bacterium]|nr:cytochrome c oxidase subunit II [Acidimicrobiia bacterium]
MRPRLARYTQVVPVVGTAVLLAGCSRLPDFGAPDPASEQGEQIHTLWRSYAWAAVAVGLFMSGLIAYVLIRYRRRNDDVPRQNPYNIPIEILYTVAPVVIVAALFGFSISTQDAATALSDDPDVVVDVVGFQWQWRFTYPDEGVSLVGTPESGPPELVLPIGETVRFNLVADDVVHSFWVPNFLEKRDLIPGVDNALDITPNRLGTYPGRCAEFCGLDHWRMGFTVRVVEADEFAAWAADAADAGG